MKALIQGAGISGLACARVLDERGWDVTIVEAATAPRTGGYMIDFFGPGWEAAARLGVSKSAVSQRISDLEKATGTRLVTRTTRSVRLTDAGLSLTREVRSAYAQIARDDSVDLTREAFDAIEPYLRATVDDGVHGSPDSVAYWGLRGLYADDLGECNTWVVPAAEVE